MSPNQQKDTGKYGTCGREGKKFHIGAGDYSQGWSFNTYCPKKNEVDHKGFSPLSLQELTY